MKAAVFYGPGDIRIEEVPSPEPGKGEVLVKVLSCAICGTDVRIFQHGQKNVRPPHIIGHEVAGLIEKVGKGVKEYREGERVVLVTEVGCNSCRWCLEGRKNLCPHMKAIGYHYPGGFAQFILLPQEAVQQSNLLPIPDNLSFDEASLAEPLSCCINGQEYLDIGLGTSVCVIGAGPIGCMHVELAKVKGASPIFLVDISSSRLKQARKFGADFLINASEEDPVERIRKETEGEGVEIVIVACPSGRAQEQALQMTNRRGRISFFGGLPHDNPFITLDSNKIHYQEISLYGAFSSSNHQYMEALRLLSSGLIEGRKFITACLPLTRIREGLERVKEGKELKCIIHPWET